MARWSFARNTWTTAAIADATNLTDNNHVALQGGSTTTKPIASEVYIVGQATASAPNIMMFARDSTVAATLTNGGTNASLDPSTAALAAPPQPFTTATTDPQRS